MGFFKENKWKIVAGLIIIATLIGGFFIGDNYEDVKAPAVVLQEEEKLEEPLEKNESEPQKNNSEATKTEIENVESKPVEVEEPEEKQVVCALVVECKTVLENMDKLKAEKKDLIPDDGIIFSKTVAFKEGDSAFDVLKREMNKAKIHLEFNYTPAYNSTYVEGINNLYQFDCGEMSGWLYKINGEILNKASSSYTVKENDRVEFVYTCAFGDVK